MGTPLCILLVDDSPFFLELQRQFLRNTPATVLTVLTGEEALEVALENRPSLVFMDIDLPGMNGLDGCRAFKTHPELNKIPVVLLGDKGRGPGEEDAFEAGADAYLEKPLDRRAFLGVGHKFLVSIDRREPRQSCRIQVDFICRGLRRQGHCLDVSSGGMFIKCEPTASAGENLKLEFSLPGDDNADLKLDGRIAWVNSEEKMIKEDFPLGYGVEFVDITESAGVALRRFFGT